MTENLPFKLPPSPQIIEQAVACLQGGGVLAIPTDSYYALAVGAFHPAALEKLPAIKGDRSHKPFPVLIGDLSQLDQLVDAVPEIAKRLMQQFWPGLLTLVLKGKAHLPLMLKSEQGMIGVRQPDDLRVCELLNQTGPLTGTSANRSGQSPAQSADEVMQQVGSEIDLILDGGMTPGGKPSTVLQVAPDLRIIRQGSISHSAIQNVLGKVVLLC
jgi:L-threonylcarbamoyladenylate synthase